MVKKTQSIEGENPTFFLAFSHPDWFLPYAFLGYIIVGLATGQYDVVQCNKLGCDVWALDSHSLLRDFIL